MLVVHIRNDMTFDCAEGWISLIWPNFCRLAVVLFPTILLKNQTSTKGLSIYDGLLMMSR